MLLKRKIKYPELVALKKQYGIENKDIASVAGCHYVTISKIMHKDLSDEDYQELKELIIKTGEQKKHDENNKTM